MEEIADLIRAELSIPTSNPEDIMSKEKKSVFEVETT